MDVKVSNGNLFIYGYTDTLIKNLKVRGSSLTLNVVKKS